VLAATLVMSVGAPLPAGAEPTFEATVSPAELSYPETTSLDYGLRITTGAEPARLRISVETASSFPGEGEFLILGAPRLEGPGTFEPGPSFHGDPPACPFGGETLTPRHGGLYAGFEANLSLPPGSTSTLVVPAAPGRHAPWAGMEARLRFSVSTGGEILSPAARLTGRFGVRLTLDPARPCAAERVGRGRAIDIAGATRPAIPRQKVRLQFVPPGLRTPVTLADVRVGADGRFGLPGWRPRLPGDYEVGALYQSQSPELADDFSAPLAIRVGASPPRRDRISGFDTRARATPRPSRGLRLSPGIPARRGRFALVRLACPYLGSTCAGTVRLSRRGVPLGARRFEVPPGWEIDLAVPLGSAAQRALRRGTLRVIAQAADVRGGREAARAITLGRR
jgi:hypothetical protein